MQGDEDAFRELVDRYQEPLLNYLYRFTSNRELAEEITQETFIAILQNMQNFRKGAKFRPWIYAIATNKALNILRRRNPTCDNLSLQKAVSDTVDPVAQASRQELITAVQQALQKLPAKQRAIFILRFYQGLAYEEIATAIGCPVGTVKSRMCYALKKLRSVLSAYRNT